MKAWRAAVTMVAVLAAGSAGAATDNARARGGGSSGSSSSAGGRHTSGGSHSSSSSGSYSSGSDSGSSSHASRPPTGPQLRHPRAGTGTGHFHNGYYGGYYPYYGYGYYNPYYYGFGYNWYAPFYFGAYYGPGYGYGYGGGYDDPGPYYGQHGYGASYHAGQVRVLVQPSNTRVYVDGYYAGEADDFDGIFQRLNTSAGGHDISLRLEGYRTFNVKLYVPDDGTIKLQHKMERGTGEENAGVMGVPQEYPRYEGRRPADEPEVYGDDRDRDRRADQAGDRALVRLDVQPADASVYVDGVFRGTGRDLRQLRLPAGRHRIEVVRPGYRTIERDVEVAPGQTLDVGIDLERG